MDRIIRLATDNRIMVVEPGVINQLVQDNAAAQGFFWPPDPSSAAYCTVGGNLACNAAGPRAIRTEARLPTDHSRLSRRFRSRPTAAVGFNPAFR
ncbi:MAG: FAD-binding protein, partial [Planctomycetes bacterium]|nr:FAD-binding protein [Planctomycetota bacterium]